MIAIIDYGMGNLKSVQNALEYLGYESIITNNIKEIKKADKLILPGVGAFQDAMEQLVETKMDQIIYEAIESKKPFLGVCLGMQLLFEESEEGKGVKGLGIFKGKFKKFSKDVIVPHMGWNSLRFPKESRLFENIKEDAQVYFVHSYYLDTEEKEIISALTNYSKPFGVAVEKENLFAVQFHPEKSGEVGLQILRNFGGLK